MEDMAEWRVGKMKIVEMKERTPLLVQQLGTAVAGYLGRFCADDAFVFIGQ